jgi:hypothetical protein
MVQFSKGKTTFFELGNVAGAYLDKVFLDAYYRFQQQRSELS